MTKKSIIPPSPTKADYMDDPDYARIAKANETDIFGYEDPLALFSEWMAQARQSEPNDSNAMALATCDKDGLPDVRMVLLKGVDQRGFCFYTNTQSAKGQQLTANPKAALCFHWKSLRRQVRIRGEISALSKTEADAYFSKRARGSQLGAWSSQQSSEVTSRAELAAKVRETEARFEGQDIPRPPHWSGWRVAPQRIEFWRDRPFRLHDRLVFEWQNPSDEDGAWLKKRLYP